MKTKGKLQASDFLSHKDRRILLNASLLVLYTRSRRDMAIFQDDLIRVATLANQRLPVPCRKIPHSLRSTGKVIGKKLSIKRRKSESK